jgi:hypothetical protein
VVFAGSFVLGPLVLLGHAVALVLSIAAIVRSRRPDQRRVGVALAWVTLGLIGLLWTLVYWWACAAFDWSVPG